MNNTKWLLIFIVILLSAGCSGADINTPELKVMTHDAFSVSESIIRQFEDQFHTKLVFIKSGDTGSLINRAILTSAAPEADVLYGIDNTYLSRSLDANIFDTYQSPNLKGVPREFILDPGNHVTPIDYGDVCINYDRKYFASNNLAVPRDLDDLTQSRYKGLLVVENPAISSPGLAFLLTTISRFGEEGYLEYWQKLKANDLVVVNDWSIAYLNNFSASSGKGMQPMVVSYNTSPAAEVFYESLPVSEAPTGVISTASTCFRQIEFAAILKGSSHRELASKFIDYMIRASFQENIPLQMFMYPVLSDAVLPQLFLDYISAADQPVLIPPDVISRNRDRWIQEWTGVVLR